MGRVVPLSFGRFVIRAFCFLVAGCKNAVESLAFDDRPVPNDVELVPVVREALVPSLLVHVDSGGFIRFPAPTLATDEMPLDTALVQAHEFQFYRLNVFVWRNIAENERAAFIDLGKVRACGRGHLERSVFERPPTTISRGLQLQLGSRWYIPFCGEYDGPETLVSVAVLANHVRFVNGRAVSDSLFQDIAFQVHGVRWEWKTEHMLTAEEAVNATFDQTRVRASSLPALARADIINEKVPNRWGVCPVWRVALERPVKLLTDLTGRVRVVSDLYVTDSECPGVLGRPMLLVPTYDQPEATAVRVSLPDSTSSTGRRTESYNARYIAPVWFESAAIAR